MTGNRDYQIKSQARDWLMRLNDATLDDAAKAEFRNWVQADPRHAAAFRMSYAAWERVGATDGALAEAMRIVQELSTRQISRPDFGVRASVLQPVGIAMAACLVLAIGLSLWLPRTHTQTYATALGDVETFQLADGSAVTLGPNAEIVVQIGDRTRHVSLEKGRAFFRVTHDETRRFSVRAGETEVRVLGTSFDLRRGPEGVRVAVRDGRVEVADLPTDTSDQDDDIRVLTKDQQVAAAGDGSLSETTSVDIAAATGWITGHLVYRNAPLSELVADLNGYRGINIEIMDRSLDDLSITAAFGVDQADQVLMALSEAHDFRLVRVGERITLISTRQ